MIRKKDINVDKRPKANTSKYEAMFPLGGWTLSHSLTFSKLNTYHFYNHKKLLFLFNSR